ncbi:MAG: hypothetical protein JW712_09675, partial [Dehalococcoidales bacterium]|nr:hypothetical protein [Dehalococcoidales bacterium]
MREVKAVFRSLLAALLVSSVLNLVSCDLFAPGLGDVVDISSPELAIVDPPIEPMSYFNSDFTISGTVSDDIGVQEVLVSWPGSRAVAEIQAGQWSVTVPFASITASGAVLFDVAASDQSGKNAAPAYRTITIDKKAPTVLITAPQVYAPGPENSNYILISGELWDESPVTSVQVEIIDPASPSTPVYTELADGDRTWSARIDLDNASVFQSGKAYLYRIVAEDAAGNINTYQYHSADFWTRLSSGETFPSMTDIGYWDQDGGTLDGFTNTDRTDMQISGALPGLTLDFTYNSDRDIPQISLSNLNMDETVAANNSLGQYVPIYASATDDKEGIDRDSVILHITGAGVDLTVDAGEFNDPSGDGLFTTFQFDLSGDNTLEPGEYTGTITVKDKKGTSKTVLFSFMINKGAPKILSLTPSSSYASVDGEGNLIVSLEVSDDNPGTTVTARAYNSEGSEINGVTASLSSALRQEDVDGETAYVADYTAVVPSPVPDFVRLDIIVNDSSNIKSSRTVSYTIDRDIPTAAITVPSDGAAISGSAFTIAGVAEDTGSNVYIVKVLVAPGELDTPPADGLWLNAEGNDTWSLPVDLSASDEGTYTVFAKAYDVADNEGLPVYSKFYFDKDVPELTVDSGTVKAYHNGDYTISGTVSDSNGLSELHGFVSKDGGAFADLPGSPVALSGTAASWSFDMTVNGDGTDDGTYEYQFIVLDIAGKSAEAAKIVIADVTAPEMFVSNLADGESVSTATYKIKGLASDFSGLADKKIEYLLNNTLPWQEKLVASTGNWELDVSGLSEGAGNTIDFRATDILGNSITLDTIHFGLDLNPPSLTIDNKAAFNGTWQRQDFTLNGTTSDANSVQSVQISTDGGATYADVSGFASGDSSWSALVSIPAGGSDDGNHLIKVKAIDGYDKETVDFLSVKYDTSAPTFVVANLADGALVTASPFGVQGSSSDNGGSGVAMMQYSLDNSTWIDISALTTWNADITFPLGLGTSGYFKVIDLVGNESAVSTVTFNTDYQLPETDGNWAGLHYESAPFSLSGTATDDLGVASVSVSGDGVGVLAIDGSAGDLNRNWSVPVTPSGDGTFEYVVRVTDAAGRYREYTRSVSYDTTPPELNVSNLADGDSVETNSYIIRGTATDSSGIQSVEYYNGSAWNAVTGTISWTQEVTGLVEGAGNSIQFRATDNAGHTTTLPAISFGLDLNPPALSIDNKATFDGTWQNSSFTLNGTSTDANGLDTIEISTDGGLTWTEATGFVSGVDAWTADVVIPSDQSEDGTHVIRVKAVDTYNKETIESLTVKYDTAAPTFSLYNLEDDQLITVASYPLLGGWSDNGGSGTVGGNAALQFSTDGGSGWTTVTTMTASAFTHNLVLAEAIDKELQFRAIDYLGNESDILILTGIDIDTALPVVDETTVNTDAQVYRTADLSLSGTASDTQGLSSLIITAAKDGADQGTVYTEASDPGNWGPYTLASGNDGIWTFTITATDIAGRTSSVTREVFMDSTDPSGAITSVPATLTNDGASFLFEGTAGDAGSGIESVKIAFAADGTGAQLAAGKTAWSATVDLVSALGTEGEKTLYVQIEDKAGNLSDWTAVQQGFVYDTALPVVTLNEAINRDVNGSFDLTGSASDNYGIASLSVTQSKDGGADILIDTNGPSGLGSWTLSNLPRDPADIGTTDTTDGTYVYKITSTDLAGKVSTTVLSTIRLDQTAPDVSIVNPGAGQTGLNALSGSAYTFRGSSDDNGGVGMAKIYYLIDQNAAASTTLTDYTALTTTGLWNFTDDFDTDHTGPDTGRAEGTWYIHVLAEDSSGNRTDFASAETVEFDIDQAAPLLTETSSGISGSTTVYRNAVITLGGDVTDGNGIASLVIKYSKNGAPEVELLNETSVVSPWEVIMDAASLGDGSFAITITAVDGVGKSTSLQRNIVIDTTLPDLTVENPVNSELVDSASYTISGKISDNGGVGVTALQYSRDNSTWTDITMTGFSWSVAGIDFSSQVGAETAQGARTLYVRATDGLNGYTSKTISFFYDTEDPVLTETAVATEDELISAASVDFNGQASDTNTLSSLVLSVNGGAAVPLAIDSDGPDDIEGNGDDNSWSYTHSNLMDGEFALVFTATDGAGRTTIVERNLLIDNTAPTTPVISSSPGAYVSYSLSVTGTAGDATSGILSVQYSVDNETTWHNLSGTTNWFGSIDVSALSIGGKTVYIRSIDRAGKISASATQAYIIDRANPGVTLNESVNRDVNGGFSLTGTSSDDYGIDTVVITQSKDGGADIPIDTNGPSGTSVWSLADLPRNPADIGTQVTFDGTFDGSYVYKITSMDSVGKSSTEILSTIRLDMTAPETLTVSNPGAGQIGVNSLSGDIFTFSGSSSDAGVGVEKIYYLIDQNAAASTTIGDYTPLLTSGYWSFSDDFDI